MPSGVLEKSLTIVPDTVDRDFNFALPVLPYIAGRELVGEIVETSDEASTKFSVGDQVIAISTDYRDLRKACFQEYVVASDFNILKLPRNVSPRQGAGVGVGFVAAALALGVCLGVDFGSVEDGPDLLAMVRGQDVQDRLAPDIAEECREGIEVAERAGSGDWIVIWGGSSVTAAVAAQLARLAGLRVVLVVNQAKHGLRIVQSAVLAPDLLIDGHDPVRAAEIISSTLKGQVRFALDTSGRESAALLAGVLDRAGESGHHEKKPGLSTVEVRQEHHADDGNGGSRASTLVTPPRTPPSRPRPLPQRSHVVGLAGLPKAEVGRSDKIALHSVPIKLFHDTPDVGRALTAWLYRLLSSGAVACPDTLSVDRGLDGVNQGLDKMRAGTISGGRAVVEMAG
ncbi:hypothetical protein Micbo1qcDRAFT_235353 [Microdochium bolleyi]|uniref:Alcohol dehydrogenase-like N-terminal domain-containing protein n=1 Tax=Microdochium bolleyi TaxID=196109 RepID=A0A136IXC3_9PEZI|nr:hypothetical protein Micbo1qcDRAFT_235353 [Microdochium bolleyi]